MKKILVIALICMLIQACNQDSTGDYETYSHHLEEFNSIDLKNNDPVLVDLINSDQLNDLFSKYQFLEKNVDFEKGRLTQYLVNGKVDNKKVVAFPVEKNEDTYLVGFYNNSSWSNFQIINFRHLEEGYISKNVINLEKLTLQELKFWKDDSGQFEIQSVQNFKLTSDEAVKLMKFDSISIYNKFEDSSFARIENAYRECVTEVFNDLTGFQQWALGGACISFFTTAGACIGCGVGCASFAAYAMAQCYRYL